MNIVATNAPAPPVIVAQRTLSSEPHTRRPVEAHRVALRRRHAHAVPLGDQRHARRAVPGPIAHVEHEDRRPVLSCGTAVVIIRSAMPDPLPKCLSPVTA